MKCFRLPTRKSSTPGYAELRRQIVIGAPASLATCLMSTNRLLAAAAEEDSGRHLDRFITEVNDRASRLKLDTSLSGQDTYVEFLAGAVASVTNVTADTLSKNSWKNLEPGVFLGESGRNSAFFVVHWQLAPGAFLPPHCHPKTSVCTLGLDGSATLRHFEAVADAPSYRDDRESEFLIRETRQLSLRAGSVSTLTEHRDNIHLFVAGKSGARGIDVTTDYGGDGSFSFLDFDPERPAERGAPYYMARWIGTNLSQ